MENYNKQKKEESKKVKEHWDYYFCNNKKGVNEITALNLALNEIAPIKNKPNHAGVTIRANDLHTDSHSIQKEWKTVSKIAYALANKVKADNNSIVIARQAVTENNTIHLYCSDTDILKDSVSSVMSEFADYQFEIDFIEDKDWKVYSELYPSERQFQSMGNRQVILQLLEKGDDLSEPREVEHTIFFKTKADRKRFLNKIQKKGFSVNDKFTEDSIKGHPFGLLISRVDKVDFKSVDEYVLELWKLAKQCKGFYDGWATWTNGEAPLPVADSLQE